MRLFPLLLNSDVGSSVFRNGSSLTGALLLLLPLRGLAYQSTDTTSSNAPTIR